MLLSGRAGRVSNGRVYRMVTSSFYEDHIPEYGTPEMQVIRILYYSIVHAFFDTVAALNIYWCCSQNVPIWHCSRWLESVFVFQRCPLDQLVLHVKVLDMGEPKAILGLALSPPNLDDIERTILMLKQVGHWMWRCWTWENQRPSLD